MTNIPNDIPAGYQLMITSQENDGDGVSGTLLSGLALEDAKFYIFIARQFSYSPIDGLSKGNPNGPNTAEGIYNVIATAMSMYEVSQSVLDTFQWSEKVEPGEEDFEPWVCDLLHEKLCKKVLGYAMDPDLAAIHNLFCRVVCGWKIHYLNFPSYDVTEKFSDIV